MNVIHLFKPQLQGIEICFSRIIYELIIILIIVQRDCTVFLYFLQFPLYHLERIFHENTAKYEREYICDYETVSNLSSKRETN